MWGSRITLCASLCRADAVTAGHTPTFPVEPWSAGGPEQDHHAISMQLATVTTGQSRVLTVPGPGWSAALAAWIGGIPKLIVRVRFSSPAPGLPCRSAPVCAARPVSSRRQLLIFRAIRSRGQTPAWSWSGPPRYLASTCESIALVMAWSAPRACRWEIMVACPGSAADPCDHRSAGLWSIPLQTSRSRRRRSSRSRDRAASVAWR